MMDDTPSNYNQMN
jgi:hypothetical protein